MRALYLKSGTAAFELITELLQAYVQRRPWQGTSDTAQIDWDTFYAISRYHRLAALIYAAARRTTQFPMAMIAAWRQQVLRHAGRTVQMRMRLIEMLAALKEAGITAIPFKGLIWGQLLYDDPADRPSTDFDFYVSRADAASAVDYFLAAGYESPYFGQAIPDDVYRVAFSLELFHSKRREYIDIHWELSDGYALFPISPAELAEHTGSIELEGVSMPRFSDEVMASLLALHGAKNGWGQYFSLLDLALFFRDHPEMDYSMLLARMKKQGTSRMLLAGAELVRQLGLVDIPVSLQRCERQCLHVTQSLLAGLQSAHTKAPRGWRKLFLHLSLRESLRSKIAFLLFKLQPKKIDLSSADGMPPLVAKLRRIQGISQKVKTRR